MWRDADIVRALLGMPVHRLGAPPTPVEVVALAPVDELPDAARVWLEDGCSPRPGAPVGQLDEWLAFGSGRALAIHAVLDEIVAPALRARRSERAFLLAATLGHRTTTLRQVLDALLDAPDVIDEDSAGSDVDPFADSAISGDEALVLRCELGVDAQDRERLLTIAHARAAARPTEWTLLALALLGDRHAISTARASSVGLEASLQARVREVGLEQLAQQHPDDAALHRELAALAYADSLVEGPTPSELRMIPGLDDERVAHEWARLSRAGRIGGAPVVLGPRSVRGFRTLPPETVTRLEQEADEGPGWLGAIDALLASGDACAITRLEQHRATRWPASRWLTPFDAFNPPEPVPFGGDALDLEAIVGAPWSVGRDAAIWARLAAADGLADTAATDARARGLLIELLEDRSPVVHEAAREALDASSRLELARAWAEHPDPRERARAAWLLGSLSRPPLDGAVERELDALGSALALDPARIVRRAIAAARLERTHRSWLLHHERAVRWAAERGGRSQLLAASPHALALRLAIAPVHARALLRYARDADLAPHARAWIEHVATWSGGQAGWTRACGTIERVLGSITTTSNETLRVEAIRWSHVALPAELRLIVADDGFEGRGVPFGEGTAEDSRERSWCVQRVVCSAYSGLLDLRLDDGRAWTIRAWPIDDGVAAQDHSRSTRR